MLYERLVATDIHVENMTWHILKPSMKTKTKNMTPARERCSTTISLGTEKVQEARSRLTSREPNDTHSRVAGIFNVKKPYLERAVM